MEKIYTLQANLIRRYEVPSPWREGMKYPPVSEPPKRINFETIYDIPVTVVADTYEEAVKLAKESLPTTRDEDTWNLSLTSLNIAK